MRKILCIIITVLIVIFASVNSFNYYLEQDENVVDVIEKLNNMGFKEAHKINYLQQKIIDVIDRNVSSSDYSALAHLIRSLENSEIYNDNVKNHFGTVLQNIRHGVLSSTSSMTMNEYLNFTCRLFSYGHDYELYYTSVVECFPYNEFTSFITAKGEQAVCTFGYGGYYDKLRNKYQDETYWYNPLFHTKSSSGEVGTYRYSDKYRFIGDFMLNEENRYWYMTDSNDPNNSYRATLYYKGEEIAWNHEEIEEFVRYIKKSNCYYYDETFFIIEKDAVTVYCDELVTFVYE